jgi:DNA repair ATPase RecN
MAGRVLKEVKIYEYSRLKSRMVIQPIVLVPCFEWIFLGSCIHHNFAFVQFFWRRLLHATKALDLLKKKLTYLDHFTREASIKQKVHKKSVSHRLGTNHVFLEADMTKVDILDKARQLPNGAIFHRCSLQVNPHHYGRTFRGHPITGGADEHAKAIMDKAAGIGVSVLAITDHNDVSSIPAFQAAAKPHGIHIFPGFELSSNEGIHILCIYPPDTEIGELERFLGEFGIRKTKPSSDLASKNFVGILDCVRKQGGVAVAAHVTNDNGLFKVLSGNARIQAWQCEHLLAIQIPGPVEDLPNDVRQIVENKNAEYRRTHPAGDSLAVAVINSKDVVKPEDLDDHSATSWIKMSEVSIEGLRQAFLDPNSRIRLNSEERKFDLEAHSELVALAWESEGFLNNASVHLNPNLNVLIGGRGTGKSTVIESIRYVLGLDPLGDEARKAHEGIIRQVLRSGTKISLLVRAYRPVRREYRIERTIPNPPLVRDEAGEVSNLSPQDIIPRVEVYGQHEISELAKSHDKLTRLLDRFAEKDDSLPQRKANLRRELEQNRRSLLEIQVELRQIEERLAALPGLEETLERFRAAGLEERLREQSLLVREERLLASIPERLAPIRECLESLRQEIPIDRLFLSAKALEGLPGKKILARADIVFSRLDQDLQGIAKVLEEALGRADEGIATVQAEWGKRREEVQTSYERILRELQKSRVDGEEFIRLRRQIEELRPLRDRQILLRRVEKEHSTHRRELLANWEDLKAEEFRHLDRAAKQVSRKLRNVVQVEVTAAGNREPLLHTLREEIGGRLSEAIEALARLKILSLPEFVEACRTNPDKLNQAYGIPPAQAERLVGADPEVLMQIEELDLPAITTIRLNTASAGEPPTWQALQDLSTGQKATAVLLLLLLESDAPLIVDQPEDDLDNRFITEGIVPRIREEKQSRQFVFSTHNANIPVLGDAELIVGLSASGEAERGHARIAPNHIGSIDSQPVRELVEDILEGGKDAFEMRRRKYGF